MNKDKFEDQAVKSEGELQKKIEAAPSGAAPRKKRFRTLRAAVVSVLMCTLICGVIYPVTATMLSKTLFPYEADGSVVTVTLADGTQRIYGSELMGQKFDSPFYLLGRVNNGAPTNISPENPEHQDNMNARLEYLRKLGYTKNGLPQNLLTSSGSGTDPHITPADAEWQVEYLAKNRFNYGWRLVIDENGNIVDYIRLEEYQITEGEQIPSDAIAGSLITVDVLEQPVEKNGSKIYCTEPIEHTLYFKPAAVETGLTVLNDYDAQKYEAHVRGIIEQYTEGRWLWIFGDPTVNVLLVNLALDGLL